MNKKGFTVLELVAAVAIFTIAVSVLMVSFSNNIRFAGNGYKEIKAVTEFKNIFFQLNGNSIDSGKIDKVVTANSINLKEIRYKYISRDNVSVEFLGYEK